MNSVDCRLVALFLTAGILAGLCLSGGPSLADSSDTFMPKEAVDVPPIRAAVTQEQLLEDWLRQDLCRIELPESLDAVRIRLEREYLSESESLGEWPTMPLSDCFMSNDSSVLEERLVELAVSDLQEMGASSEECSTFESERQRLSASSVPGSDPQWKRLYIQTCCARRQARLAVLKPLGDAFVFDQHARNPRSWKYTEAISNARADGPSQRYYGPGGSLQILRVNGRLGQVETLFATETGTVRNPDVSPDGRSLMFAWKKSDRGDDYSIYEMDLATRAVRQLTDAPLQADYEGLYLPDGNILFNSTRCVQVVDCNWVEVSNFYLMTREGRILRRVGFDQVHTIFPTLADDGRIFYTRWDYNDRAQIYTQPLFEMNPDGTMQRGLYGGNSWFPTNIIHARKIPGERRIVAIVTGHHTPAHGKLAIIDPAIGREEGVGVEFLAPVRMPEPVRVDKYGQTGMQFQYPYPIDGEHFITTAAMPKTNGELGDFHIYLIDREGRREMLVASQSRGAEPGCRQIIPLNPPPCKGPRFSPLDMKSESGTFLIQDVYEGQGIEGVARGEIDRVRVVALDFRTIGVGTTSHQGAGGSSGVSTPIAVAHGSWDVKTVLGSAQVHEDGSVFFEAPANRPLYFQALDHEGRVVQTMRSWATLMPGENQSCVGCHESKNTAPLVRDTLPLALADGPNPLQLLGEVRGGFSFPRHVQPILDRHCTECHDGRQDVPLDLQGETFVHAKMKRAFNRSYLELTHAVDGEGDWENPVVNWIDAMSGPGPLPPRYRGAANSTLCDILLEGHEDVALTDDEFETLACWIDLLVPYCGDYAEANVWSDRDCELFDEYGELREDFALEAVFPEPMGTSVGID